MKMCALHLEVIMTMVVVLITTMIMMKSFSIMREIFLVATT